MVVIRGESYGSCRRSSPGPHSRLHVSDLGRRADTRRIWKLERGAAASRRGAATIFTASRCSTSGIGCSRPRSGIASTRGWTAGTCGCRGLARSSRRPICAGAVMPVSSWSSSSSRSAGRVRRSRPCSPRSGTSSIARLGFNLVPLEEVTVEVVQKGGAPAMLVRAGRRAGPAGHCGHARDPFGARPLFAAPRSGADSLRACEEAPSGRPRPVRTAADGVLRRGGRRVGRGVRRHHRERRRVDARGSRRSRSRRRATRGHAPGAARA